MKEAILDAGKKIRIKICAEKVLIIVRVAESPGWAKLWEWKAVLGLKMLSIAKSYHEGGKHPSHLCDAATPFQEESVIDHLIARHHKDLHLNSELKEMMDSSKLLGLLSNLHLEILSKFKKYFPPILITCIFIFVPIVLTWAILMKLWLNSDFNCRTYVYVATIFCLFCLDESKLKKGPPMTFLLVCVSVSLGRRIIPCTIINIQRDDRTFQISFHQVNSISRM